MSQHDEEDYKDIILNDNNIDDNDAEDCTPTTPKLTVMPEEEENEKSNSNDNNDFRNNVKQEELAAMKPTTKNDEDDTQEEDTSFRGVEETSPKITESSNQVSLSPKTNGVDDASYSPPSVRLEQLRDHEKEDVNIIDKKHSSRNDNSSVTNNDNGGNDDGEETVMQDEDEQLGPQASGGEETTAATTTTTTETHHQVQPPLKHAVDGTASPSVRFEVRDEEDKNIDSKKTTMRNNKSDDGCDDGYDSGDETILQDKDKLGPKATLQDYKDRGFQEDFEATYAWLLEIIPEELSTKGPKDFPVCFQGRYFYIEDEVDLEDDLDDDDLRAEEEGYTTENGSTKASSSMIVPAPSPDQDCRPVLRCCNTSGEVLRRFASKQDVWKEIHQEHPEKRVQTIQIALYKVLSGINRSCYGFEYRYEDESSITYGNLNGYTNTRGDGEEEESNSTASASNFSHYEQEDGENSDDAEENSTCLPPYPSGNAAAKNGNNKKARYMYHTYPWPVERCCIETNRVVKRFASRKDAIAAISKDHPEVSLKTINSRMSKSLSDKSVGLYGYRYHYATRTARPVLRYCSTSGKVLQWFASKEDVISTICQEHPDSSICSVRSSIGKVLRGAAKRCFGHAYRYARDSECETDANETEDDEEEEIIYARQALLHASPTGLPETTRQQIVRLSLASGEIRRFNTREEAVKAILKEFPGKKRSCVNNGVYQVLRGTQQTSLGYQYNFEDVGTTRAVLRRSDPSGSVLSRFPTKEDAIHAILEEDPKRNRKAVMKGLNQVLRDEEHKTYLGFQYSYESECDMENFSQEEYCYEDESSRSYEHLNHYTNNGGDGEEEESKFTASASNFSYQEQESGEDSDDTKEEYCLSYCSGNATTKNGITKKAPSMHHTHRWPVERCCMETNRVLKRFGSRKDAIAAISKDHPDTSLKAIDTRMRRILNGELPDLYGYNYRYATQCPVLRCSTTSGRVLQRFASKEDAISTICKEHPESNRHAVQNYMGKVLRGISKTCFGHKYRYARDSEYETDGNGTEDDDEEDMISPMRPLPHASLPAPYKITSGPLFRRSIASGMIRTFNTKQGAVREILKQFPEKKEKSVIDGIYRAVTGRLPSYLGHEYSFEEFTPRAVLRRSDPSGQLLARFPTREDAVQAILDENPERNRTAVLRGLNIALKGEVRKAYLGFQYSYESDSADNGMESFSQEEEEESIDEALSSLDEIETCSSGDSEDLEVGSEVATNDISVARPRTRQQLRGESPAGISYSLPTAGDGRDEPVRHSQVIQRTSTDGEVAIFADRRTAARALAEATDMGTTSENILNMLENGIVGVLNSDHATYMHFKFCTVNLILDDSKSDGQDPPNEQRRRPFSKRKESPTKTRGGRKTKRRKLATIVTI